MIKIGKILIKFLIVFILSVIIILKIGVKIDNFEFGGLNLEKLYIKLDKKIIFRAKNITIAKIKNSQKNTSGSEFYKLSQNIVWIDKLFQEISLQNLDIGGLRVQILYKDDIFFIDSPYLKVDLKLDEMIDEKMQKLQIKNLTLKDFNLSFQGISSANIKDKKYTFSGNFQTHEISGKADIKLVKDELRYKIYDANASSLENFMNEIGLKTKLDDEIKEWIYGYIKAKSYFIDELKGLINIQTSKLYLNELYARARAKNLSISLDKTLNDILVDDANLTLENAKLSFSLNNPTYRDKKLDGSSLYIYDIFNDKKSGIFINIKTNSIYDGSINDILKAYGINLPITQKSGNIKTDLKLNINFDTLNVIANGKFIVSNAKIDIANALFKTKNAQIELKNSDTLIIKAKDFGMDFFDLDADVKIDLNTSKAIISGKLKSLKIDEIIDINNENLIATLDYSSKDTILNFHELGLMLSFNENINKIIITNEKLAKKSTLLNSIGIDGFKEISIESKDFKGYDIKVEDAHFNLPFHKKNGEIYNKDSFKISVKDNFINGFSQSGFLNFEVLNKNDVKLNIKDLDLIIKNDENGSNFSNNLGDITANLLAKNSNIILADTNTTLALNKYQIWAKQDFVKLGSNAYSGRINLSKIKDELTIEARDIDGKFINELFKHESFEGGKFKLKTIGNSNHLKGEIRFYDTYFKDYIFYQQLLTFINSIPSLLTFKTPDFNQRGFSAKSGKILFEKDGDLLKFIAIDIKGTSADIIGTGDINLKTKAINIDLEIEILKDASSIISAIPLVNQIILGKDRTLSTLIKLRGTTDKPEYSSQVLTDTLLAPFKLVRNLLQIPFLIFE